MRKSQLTSFIIIGIVLLLFIALLFLLKQEEVDRETNPENTLTLAPEIFPVSTYVDYCTQKELRKLVLNFSRSDKTLYSPNSGNYILSYEELEQDLAQKIIPKLEECIDITEYEKEGYSVQLKEKVMNITISKNELFAKLTFPITLSKEEVVLSEDTFVSKLNMPLGKIIDDVNDIVNTEFHHNFDLDYYRLNNPEYEITKSSIYPAETYNIIVGEKELSNYIEFNFEIENLALTNLKFNNPDFVKEKPIQPDEGICKINEQCFEHAKENICLQNNGKFEKTGICKIENRELTKSTLTNLLKKPEIVEQVDIYNLYDSICNEWYDAEVGELVSGVRYNGESWCSKEPGVGGRHYKLSCVKGDVIVEQCTDFKEDLCVEEKYSISEETFSGQFSTATCRANQFNSCSDCTTENCCSNNQVRDCIWDSNSGCYPNTPPGIEFWNKDLSSGICAKASKDKTTCYSLGDCGSMFNYFGDFSGTNPDFYNQLSIKASNLSKEITKVNQFSQSIDVPLDNSFEFIENLNRYLKNIDEALAYDINDYLNPALDLELSEAANLCEPWTPPVTNNCNECNKENIFDGTKDYSSCTEYKCNSLGPNCIFEIKNDIPHCSLPESSNEALKITNTFSENNYASDESSSLGSGVRLDESISKSKALKLNLETNHEALCKISYLPNKDFNSITNSDLSNKEFSRFHSLDLAINHEYNIFDKILEYFEMNSYESLMDELIDLRYKYEAFKIRFPDLEKYQSGLYPILVPLVDYYLDTSTQEKLSTIFSNIEEDTYFIFIKCIDRSSTETDDYYIRFNIDDPCLDVTPPKILKTIPANNELFTEEIKVYTNELAKCKFDSFDLDYNQMKYDLDCETNEYSVSSVANGTYECKAKIPEELKDSKVDLFVKCMDHPEYERRNNYYEFNFNPTNEINNFSEFNLTITNKSNIITIDLEDLINTKDYGTYNISTPKVFDFNELIFNEAFTCSNSKCSTTRCILKNSTTTFCERKLPECTVYEQNTMEQSTKISLFQREPLKIIATAFQNNTITVSYKDSSEAKTNCGIEFEEEIGYEKMIFTENKFQIKPIGKNTGVHTARILCINKYGDKQEQTIKYSIS